jgi:tetratricopeptide (TPR) repeat protein
LTRLAKRDPEKRALLRKTLEVDLPTLAPLAARVALETGEPMPAVLSETLAESPLGADAAARVETELPLYTIALLNVAAEVAKARLDSADESELAPALIEYAERLADAGSPHEARKPAWDAVALLREDETARGELAHALIVASRCEYAAYRRAEAIPPAREAVEIYREIAGGAPHVRLAGGLLNLGNRLSDESGDEALVLYREAADIFRALIEIAPRRLDYQLEDAVKGGAEKVWLNFSPETSAPPPAGATAIQIDLAVGVEPSELRHGLAIALMNVIDQLMRRHDMEGAQSVSGEAVELLRDLAADRPDTYRLQLGIALTWQAGALCDAEPDRAVVPAEEAAEILRAIGAQRPAAVTWHLGWALVTLSTALMGLQRWPEVLDVTRELDALEWADHPLLQERLFKQFEHVSAALASENLPEDAADASRHAVAIARGLLAGDDRAGQTRLASALHNLGRRLRATGDDDGAHAAAAEALSLIAAADVDAQVVAAMLSQYKKTTDAVGAGLDLSLPLAAIVKQMLTDFPGQWRRTPSHCSPSRSSRSTAPWATPMPQA